MATPVHTHVDTAPSFWADGGVWTVVAAAAATEGRFTMQDQLMPRDSGAPPHLHERYEGRWRGTSGLVRTGRVG